MNEQQFEKRLQQLEKELQPRRDLWPDIANQLEQTPQQSRLPAAEKPAETFWLMKLASAAALLLVVLIGWQITVLPPSEQPVATPLTAELLLLQVYEQQKAQQLARVVAVAEGYDNWQQQLVIWDQAIAQVRLALQFYPDEPQLLAQLQTLYQQQLSFIRRATLHQPLLIS
ncbi:hypothetical protein [Arsukibacterium sp.]|uniref:hypothetical protein n=1 Tax=Arsukibacterium sp. TaxID=1977258 RepID=UPI00299DB425|nr:hypothetical protein [Arsukibacterium sp.]MDX1678943.1 hypothetical protein [Arsukibacterium sp.]